MDMLYLALAAAVFLSNAAVAISSGTSGTRR